MQPDQPGWLFPFALFFIFVFAPCCIWGGYHWLHHFEHAESHEEEHQ